MFETGDFMAMSKIWSALILISFIFAAKSGRLETLSASALEGAESAVTLCLSLAGIICLWSGVLEAMKRCGMADGLACITRPLLGRLFPSTKENTEAAKAVSANFSANLLGLGNAATPFGIRAVQLLKSGETATDDMCNLVVMNTASVQLFPATIAAVRSGLGCVSPLDILPAIWLTSLCSVSAGLAAAKFFSKKQWK